MSYLFAPREMSASERTIVSGAPPLIRSRPGGWSQLAKIPFGVVFGTGAAAMVLRALAGLVLLAGALWFLNEWLKSSRLGDTEAIPPPCGKSTV
jgi:hypothetical protein